MSAFSLFSCTDNEQSLDERIKLLNLQTAPPVTHPADNPTSEARVELGRLLFWDPILSGERDISCGSCHHPSLAYGDAIPLSFGPGATGLGSNRIASVGRPPSTRNSTSIVNSAYVGLRDANQLYDPNTAPLNWHINRRSLAAQAFAPMGNVRHMLGKAAYNAASTPDSVLKRVKAIAEYVALFDQAFNGSNGSGLTRQNLGGAIATFERSIVSVNSAYDRYAKGELDALTEQQKAGLLLFFGKANCSNCHTGPMFSDFSLYNLGIKYHPLINNPKDKGDGKNFFRTPTLRNVELTAPYMHNGTMATLREVIEFYNNGVTENDSISQSQMSIKIKPLNLSEFEKDNLLSFLEALTDESYDRKIPARVPSRLKVGGN